MVIWSVYGQRNAFAASAAGVHTTDASPESPAAGSRSPPLPSSPLRSRFKSSRVVFFGESVKALSLPASATLPLVVSSYSVSESDDDALEKLSALSRRTIAPPTPFFFRSPPPPPPPPPPPTPASLLHLGSIHAP
eukprot:31158-Pelagococcus_subviridis.AAC.2